MPATLDTATPTLRPHGEALPIEIDRRVDRGEQSLPEDIGILARRSIGWITANSSPPKRASVSLARRQLRSLSATVRKVASPAGWPRKSLMFLK